MFNFNAVQASANDLVGQITICGEILEFKRIFKNNNSFDLYRVKTKTSYYVSNTKVGLEIYKYQDASRRPVYVKKTAIDDLDDDDDTDEYFGTYKKDEFDAMLVNYLKNNNIFKKGV